MAHSTALITTTGSATVDTISLEQWADQRIAKLLDLIDQSRISQEEYEKMYSMILDEVTHPHVNSRFHA